MALRTGRGAEQRVRTELAQAFPDLPVRDVAFLGSGVDSAAYLVNGEWVFRFPKRAAAARALGREVALLTSLAEYLPVAVPRFAYLGRQAGTGRLFAGYPIIRGQPLTADLFLSLAETDQERVLATLAGFLRGVHGFPVAAAAAAGVPELSTRAWVRSRWSRGRASVLALLAPRDAAALAGLIRGFLGDARNFAYRPCLLYADFAPEHILYDVDRKSIAGIIDWGDLAIGDPDFDLLYLRQDYGEAFVRRLLAHHPHPEPARLLEKLRVFDACDHVMTIAAGQAAADRAAIDESVAALGEILAPG
jgi:aminoglycoside 2''-phosphotransferase